MPEDLERLYQDARSALKAKDFDRASNLLRQILLIDENYKDASRLLAQIVKLRRRRWYNHPLLWCALGILLVIVAGYFIGVGTQEFFYSLAPSPTLFVPTGTPSRISPSPTVTQAATETATLLPTLTVIPLTWRRVAMGQEFPRDTVTALTIDPKDPDVLYASMENAGIYKSIDGGLSWGPVLYGLTDINVRSLVIDDEDTQIVYAGTRSGIFKSKDGGGHWSKIGEGDHLLIDPQDNFHLYARDADHIYESANQGQSWKTVYSSKDGCPGKILSWAIHPSDGKTLYLGGGDECERGIYQSDDGGHTWTLIQKVENPPGYEMAPWLDYLIVRMDWLDIRLDEGIVKVNYGPSWQTPDAMGSVYSYCDPFLCKSRLNDEASVRLGKPEVGAVAVIAVSPHDPNIIYAAGEGMAVSRDGGQAWSKRNNGLGTLLMTLETGAGTPPTLYLQQEDCASIERHVDGAFDPAEEKEPGQNLYISNDGGKTWELAMQTGCYLVKDIDEMTFYRVGQVFEGREGATDWVVWIWRSQDGGKTWKKLVPPMHSVIDTISVQGGSLYLYEVQENEGEPPAQTEYVSEDHGKNWRRINPPRDTKICYGSTLQFIDTYRPTAIDPSNGNHVFVIDNGILLESHDSCDTTVTSATAPNTNMNSIAFDPNQPDTIYAGTDSGAYASFDGGKTWNEINDGLLGATVIYSIVVDKESNVYAATPYGIFKLEEK